MRGINKYLMVGLALLFAVGSIVIGMNYSARRLPQDGAKDAGTTKKVTKETQTSGGATAQKEAYVLFLDDDYVFLNEDITDAYLEVVASKIDQEDQEEVDLYEQAKQKWAIQKGLNELFTQPVLVGSRVLEAPNYKETTTSERKAAVATALSDSGFKDAFAETVTSILGQESGATGTETDTPVDTGLVAPSSDDTTEIRHAKEQLTLVVQNGQVVPEFTMDGYLIAKASIAAVPDGEVKQALLNQLGIVEAAMTNMGIAY